MRRILFSLAILLLIGAGCQLSSKSSDVITGSAGDYMQSGRVSNTSFEGLTQTFAAQSAEYNSDLRSAMVLVARDNASQKAILDEVSAHIDDEADDENPYSFLYVSQGYVYMQKHLGDELKSCTIIWPSGDYMVVLRDISCDVETDGLWRAYLKKYPPSSMNLMAE